MGAGLALGAALVSGAARAEMAYEYPGVLKGVTAGFFCVLAPDGAADAQGGGGRVNLFSAPFDFVKLGDEVPAQPGIGIGVVAQMGPFGRDDIYFAEEEHGDPCCSEKQRWTTRVLPNGQVWLGYLGPLAQDMPVGEWHFTLWRGSERVFSYVMRVGAPDPEAPLVCARPLS